MDNTIGIGPTVFLAIMFGLSVGLYRRTKIYGVSLVAGGFALLLFVQGCSWFVVSLASGSFAPALPPPDHLPEYLESTRLMLNCGAWIGYLLITVGYARLYAAFSHVAPPPLPHPVRIDQAKVN